MNRNISVLLVGISPSSCPDYLTSLMEQKGKGFEISGFQRVGAALKFFESNHVDVVILWKHDGEDVLKAVDEFHSHYPAPSIMVLASSKYADDGLEVMSHGADDFLIEDEITNGTLPRAISYAVHRRDSQSLKVQRKMGLATETVSRVNLDKLRQMQDEFTNEGVSDGPEGME